MTFDEWFHKEYEPADLQIKQCAERKESIQASAKVYLEDLKKAFEAGRPKWHKVADGDLPKGENHGRDGVHRDIYLKDRYGNLYTGNYFPKDENHEEDCFAVNILDWGFRGSQFCKKEQISEWCEILQYTEE